MIIPLAVVFTAIRISASGACRRCHGLHSASDARRPPIAVTRAFSKVSSLRFSTQRSLSKDTGGSNRQEVALRLPASADDQITATELRWVKECVPQRDAATLANVRY